MKLSVVLAVRNEKETIGACLESVRDIADEIVVLDEYSTDHTVEIAKKFGAKVYEEPHHEIFHITKEKALEKAQGEWILQLDADERVTRQLADEIKEVTNSSNEEIKERKVEDRWKWALFQRHQEAVEARDGKIGKDTGEVVAFFIPRKNYFLGRPLIHAGVYPDGVIRLVKKGKTHFPAKSVHEQIVIDGEVSWLTNDLIHDDSPTLARYFKRLNRYTNLQADELKEKHIAKNIFTFMDYVLIKPSVIFLKLYLRHKGFKDGGRGFLWSFLSASHYPIAFFKYLTGGAQ